jgi:hypothetical protein
MHEVVSSVPFTPSATPVHEVVPPPAQLLFPEPAVSATHLPLVHTPSLLHRHLFAVV